jgi:hypothetical protein
VKKYLFLFGAVFASGVYAQSDSLCEGSRVENTIFSCQVKKKTLSICASTNLSKTSGYIQYRYGINGGKMDLEFPTQSQKPSDFFLIGIETNYTYGDLNWLRGTKGEFSYVVYSNFMHKGNEESGVKVFKNSKMIANLKCDEPDESFEVSQFEDILKKDKVNPDGEDYSYKSSEPEDAAPQVSTQSVITPALVAIPTPVTSSQESRYPSANLPKTQRNIGILAVSANRQCLPYQQTRANSGRQANSIDVAYTTFYEIAMDGDSGDAAEIQLDASTQSEMQSIHLNAHEGLSEDASKLALTCANALKEYSSFILGEEKARNVIAKYEADIAVAKKEEEFKASPAGQLIRVYKDYLFLKMCYERRKDYALVYLTKPEFDRVNQDVRKKEADLLRVNPGLAKQKDSLWNEATKNYSSKPFPEYDGAMRVLCQSALTEFAVEVPVKKGF